MEEEASKNWWKVKKEKGGAGVALMVAVAVAGAMVLLLRTAPAAAEDDLVAHTQKGKETFERICGECHGIDRPQNKNMDRPAWEELVSQMEERGAKMSGEERELILDYLGIRNLFLTKCTVCHTKERIYDWDKAFQEWKAIVEEMAARNPELMSEGEARSIVAYLTVVMGVSPSGE